tara:strand:+ start:209 stop:472 length:264 start_codon:yes stop_codon:yes gene_type:complete
MKIFFYKTIFVAFVFFITFKLTVGSLVNELENKFHNIISKENIERLKDDLRKQIKTANEKDRFINKEDSELINAFINKIKKDLNKKN